MSNPYDPNNPSGQQPYGSQPYGSPIPSGGGGGYGNPYGTPGSYGNELPKKTDVVSIIGFILSLTCCLSLVGFIMGLIGLKRTGGGQRKGRWAAISASIIGLLGTILAVGGTILIVVFAGSFIQVDEAERGQCADITTEDSSSVSLRDKDCGDDHDAEITYAGGFSDVEALGPEFVPDDINDLSDAAISSVVCTSLMDPADVEALGDDVEYQFVSEDGNPSGDDPFFCYVERSDGEPFTSKQLP